MEIKKAEYYEEMNRVVEMLLRGKTSPIEISRSLGISRAKVLTYIDAWKQSARNMDEIQNRAKEILSELDAQYNYIINEYHDIIDDTLVAQKDRAAALKNMADVLAKRQEIFAKAGIMTDAEITDELIEWQEKYASIERLLVKVAKENPSLRLMIMDELRRISGESPPVPIENG